MRRPSSSTARAASAAATGAAAAWTVRHLRSPAVRGWSHGGGRRIAAGDGLAGRLLPGRGTGPAVVLLHGLLSSGDQFGAAYDELSEGGDLYCPDLLGFGDSCTTARAVFDLDAHLDALDDALARVGLTEARLVVAGHSMGGILALHLAARHRERVDGVVLWSAPLAPNVDAARRRVRSMGLLERLFALDGRLPRVTCRWMCRHRRVAAVVATLLYPGLPVPLSTGAVRHTWPAYRGAMDSVVLDQRWRVALDSLRESGVPVRLLFGDEDEVVDGDHARKLAMSHANVELEVVTGAGHLLPLTHARRCVRHLRRP